VSGLPIIRCWYTSRLTDKRHRMNPSYLRRAPSDCVSPDPANTLTDRLNKLLNSSGTGYVLSLCPGQQYPITAPLLFAAPSQEISTAGYPTGNDRATLIVSGPVFSNGTGHTTAVDGTCHNCNGVTLRNVQVRLCCSRPVCILTEVPDNATDQWHEAWRSPYQWGRQY